MTEQLPIILTALAVGVVIGLAAMYWLRSRPVTTKAEALRLLAAEATLVAKMPGAMEAHQLAEAQAQDEQLALVAFNKAVLKASGAAASV